MALADARARRTRARVVQPALLVRRGRLPLRRDRRRAGRRSSLPPEPDPGDLARPSGARARDRWRPVFEVVRERLLTPVGLRSLAPGHRDYKAQYYGDLRARDAAYHQGTVWGWLVGPFVDAWLKVHPDDKAGARRVPRGIRGAPRARRVSARSARSSTPRQPYTPRGCIAQAWSVAEVLRAWLLDRAYRFRIRSSTSPSSLISSPYRRPVARRAVPRWRGRSGRAPRQSGHAGRCPVARGGGAPGGAGAAAVARVIARLRAPRRLRRRRAARATASSVGSITIWSS